MQLTCDCHIWKLKAFIFITITIIIIIIISSNSIVIVVILTDIYSVCVTWYRRLFPTVRVRVGGLMTSRNYVLLVDVVPVDECRYRYEYSTWFVSEADHSRRTEQDDTRVTRNSKQAAVIHGQTQSRAIQAQVARPRCYVHPDSPTTGDYWMKQSVISFHRLKLTNNINDLHGNVS